MKYLLVLALAGCAFANATIEAQWQQFKVDHGRSYTDKEEACRRALFEKNLAYIVAHNLRAEQGLHSYTLGVNLFADMTSDEVPKGLWRPGMAEERAAKDAQWAKFKADHERRYALGEEACRRAVFEENVAHINAHNLRFDQGLESYSMGVNQFTDLTSSEIPTGLIN